MTMGIGVVFAILETSMLLFITGWIRADIGAVLALVSLAATGVLEVEEVLKGFSSEAVIAISGLLILSAGLVRCGVARWIAERLNDIAGGSRKRLTSMSTLVPGVLSGFVTILPPFRYSYRWSSGWHARKITTVQSCSCPSPWLPWQVETWPLSGPRITLWSTICFDPRDSQGLVSSKLRR